MRTKFLDDWQRAAIVESVRHAIERGELDRDSGQSLLKEVDAASHIRLSFRGNEEPT